jgi:hypothetical protein
MENTNLLGGKPVPKTMLINRSHKKKVNVGWTRLEEKGHNDKGN